MYALEVMAHAQLSTRHPVRARPLIVGRAPECDIVIAHAAVSRRHAAVWLKDDAVWIEDLKSRNGVFVDDVRVVGEVEVHLGQRIRLGSLDALRVRARSMVEPHAPRQLAIEDVGTGYQIVLGADPIQVGSGRDCALRLPAGPEVAAIVVRQREEEAWLGADDDMVELVVDEPFTVAGRELVLRAVPSSPASTVAEGVPSAWPYRVIADRGAPGGPLVTVEATGSAERVQLHATNSAILLFLLARAWVREEGSRVAPEDRGWVDDETVAVGVWGKDGPLRQMKVLVCRLRQELREAGLDPWFVEKRRGALRIRVSGVTLTD